MNPQQISLNDPQLPIEIKNAICEHWNKGDQLFQVETTGGTEWWHINSNGELIDALWLEY